MVQTGERKQFSLFDFDLWPTTLTYNHRLAEVKVDPLAKNPSNRGVVMVTWRVSFFENKR